MRQAATVADGDPSARSQVFSCSATTSAMAERNASRITQGSARWSWNAMAKVREYHATEWEHPDRSDDGIPAPSTTTAT
jgi:hypothetical protein